MVGERKILVVDDIAMFRELERMCLSHFGAVTEASTAREALARMSETDFDAVVLDWRLPDMSGDEVAPQMKELQPQVPLIVIGSEGAPKEHEAAVRAGADDVLAKPIARSMLVASVARFFGRNGCSGLPRAEVDSPIYIRAGDATSSGRVSNVSRGGLFIATEDPPEVSSELCLNFELPEESEAFRPTAQVVWRRVADEKGANSGVGVRFLAIARTAAQNLERFVYERAPSPTTSTEEL